MATVLLWSLKHWHPQGSLYQIDYKGFSLRVQVVQECQNSSYFENQGKEINSQVTQINIEVFVSQISITGNRTLNESSNHNANRYTTEVVKYPTAILISAL